MGSTDDDDYILGSDHAELERLGFQHEVWVKQAFTVWEIAGFGAGQTVVDLGCGPGFTSFDLATVVGREGRVLAVDRNAGFLEFLAAERSRRGLPQVEPHRASAESLELAAGSVDGCYARWLFCWLADPGAALARVARCVRPGGAIAVQDYCHWATLRIFPRSAVFERAVDACMRSWREGGGIIDVAMELPAHAAGCGLRVEHLRPIARIGRVGSLEWRWVGTFFANYLPRVVARGLLAEEDRVAVRVEWEERTREGASFVQTPTMTDLVMRRV